MPTFADSRAARAPAAAWVGGMEMEYEPGQKWVGGKRPGETTSAERTAKREARRVAAAKKAGAL
jgi:hypothetical protein